MCEYKNLKAGQATTHISEDVWHSNDVHILSLGVQLDTSRNVQHDSFTLVMCFLASAYPAVFASGTIAAGFANNLFIAKRDQ